jgi:anti-sigma B factor antagonist
MHNSGEGRSITLQTRLQEIGNTLILHVQGEVDLVNAHDFLRVLLDLVGRRRPLVVNLSDLSYIDVSGIRALEAAERQLQESGQPLVLCGSSYQVHRVFEAAQLARRIRLVPSVEAGISFLRLVS